MLQKTAILATNTIFREIDFNLTTHCGVITTSFIKSSWQPIHPLSCQYKPERSTTKLTTTFRSDTAWPVRSGTQLDLTLLPDTAVTLRNTPKTYVPIRYCHTLANATQHRHYRTCLSFTAVPVRNSPQLNPTFPYIPLLPNQALPFRTQTNNAYTAVPNCYQPNTAPTIQTHPLLPIQNATKHSNT